MLEIPAHHRRCCRHCLLVGNPDVLLLPFGGDEVTSVPRCLRFQMFLLILRLTSFILQTANDGDPHGDPIEVSTKSHISPHHAGTNQVQSAPLPWTSRHACHTGLSSVSSQTVMVNKYCKLAMAMKKHLQYVFRRFRSCMANHRLACSTTIWGPASSANWGPSRSEILIFWS